MDTITDNTAAGATPEPGATQELAAFAAGLAYDHLPPAVVERLKACLLDALGCCVFGVTLPWTRMLIDLAREEGGNPQARIIGTGLTGSISQAVLIGATAGHGFEMDDIHAAAHLHAGSLAVPAALALAETQPDLDGRALIAALAAGYEVGLRVSLAATGALFMRGHHFQGACGPFVAAATAANLLRLTPQAARHGLGIAGSFGAGLMAAQEGAMSKRLHCGRAAQAGVQGAQLAARGFTGIPNVIEAPYGGFLSTLSGAPDMTRLVEDLGSRWEIRSVGFKPYATAASVQTVLFLVDRLMTEHALSAKDIDTVLIHCSTMAHRHCAWPYQPVGVTAAQMNLFFTTAMMIIDRAAMQDQFVEARLTDPNALAMIERIRIVVDPAYDVGGDRTRHYARVELSTKDGRRLKREEFDRPGSPGNPLSPLQLQRKFESLAGGVLPADRIARIIETVAHIEKHGARVLMDLVTSTEI
jgi:2-methylcitrate dehydratase PrpD